MATRRINRFGKAGFFVLGLLTFSLLAGAAGAVNPAVSTTVSQPSASTAEDARNHVAQIGDDVAHLRRVLAEKEDTLNVMKFVTIPLAQGAVAAAQKKLKDVQSDPKASIGDVFAAQLLLSGAQALLDEAINAKNNLQREVNDLRARIQKLETSPGL